MYTQYRHIGNSERCHFTSRLQATDVALFVNTSRNSYLFHAVSCRSKRLALHLSIRRNSLGDVVNRYFGGDPGRRIRRREDRTTGPLSSSSSSRLVLPRRLRRSITLGYSRRFFSEGHDDKTQPRRCNAAELGQCEENERCFANISDQQGLCECQREFHSVNGKCVRVVTPSTVNIDLTTLKPEFKPESGGGGTSCMRRENGRP